MNIISTLFSQDEFIGIHLGYKNTYITIGSCTHGSVEIEWQKVSLNTEENIYNEKNFVKYFSNIISTIPNEFKTRYLPIQIALPDPLFKIQKLHFSDFPRGYIEQSLLVSWQLAKISHGNAEQFCTTWQMLAEKNNKQRVFAYGIDKHVVENIQNILIKEKLQLSTINADSYYRYNILTHDLLSQSGVLLALENDYWSLMFWDKRGYLSHIHTAVREINTINDISDIVAETERLVLSYIQNEGEIENIYITAVGKEKEQLETEINQALEHKCKWLLVDGTENIKFNNSGIVDLATIIKP